MQNFLFCAILKVKEGHTILCSSTACLGNITVLHTVKCQKHMADLLCWLLLPGHDAHANICSGTWLTPSPWTHMTRGKMFLLWTLPYLPSLQSDLDRTVRNIMLCACEHQNGLHLFVKKCLYFEVATLFEGTHSNFNVLFFELWMEFWMNILTSSNI
jgi:hypothetical protein